jgi:MAC/Perforin domain
LILKLKKEKLRLEISSTLRRRESRVRNIEYDHKAENLIIQLNIREASMKSLKKLIVLLLLLYCSFSILFVTGCKKDNPTQPEQNPNENLLPGVSYIGHGYNIFGEYAKSEYVKSPLFKYDNYQTVVVQGKSYNVPSDIQYTIVNTSDFKSIYGENSYQYRQSLGINANLSGSYSFFSLSVKNNYSEEQYRSNYRAFCTIQNVIKKWKLTLPYTDLAKLKSMLTDEARNDIANLAPETLFNKYGTHFITELTIGARADYNTCVSKTFETSTIKNNFQICAEASFKKKSGSGSYDMVTEQQLQTFESNSYQNLKVAGGKSEYGSYIFQTGNYDKWIESIDNIESLTISDFTNNSLLPIWDLSADDARKNQLISAYDSYAQQFDLSSLMDEAIEGFYFEVTNNPPITPEPGWTMIDVDLNRDAGGAYIYLCYRNGLDDQESISGITFITGSQALPTGYTKINQDLNQGSGSPQIYLCYKKEVTSNPIRRVDVLVGENAVPANDFYFGENYYSGTKQDLNQGVSGNFIWLVYSYSLPNPWQ